MNETTSTPDEPDGRGRLATGEQAAIPQQANGQANAPEATAPAQPGGTAGTNGSAPAQAEEVVTAERPSDPTGADAPTAHIQLPQPPQAEPAQQASAPEAPAAPSPSPSPRPVEPEPAPGPMPGPGPEAAAPPPWHRMSGGGGTAEPAPEPLPEQEPEDTTLLDEGPTAFLEPPARYDEQRAGSGPASESGSWSSVRAMRNRPPRQAALQLKRLDPWSVLKLGLVLAVVLFFIWLVAVGVLYGALDGMGVWDRLNGTYADLVSGDTPTGSPLISAGRVFGFAAVIGAINSLLFAVAVTVGAFVYNVSADLVGGIEVTLSERD
ncbi:DUF3566 domain-containing protein [Pseudonocardia cypriaca]|uniref:Transmembrane protein DUF3566 n=1 Tax=Pseudonocardia cypriaca TaxID=882449 RepID=A0A543FQD7_9PSEU|nr:transmembrane protein DUF3566 [Pseudonocardia cypriaca]